MSRSSECDFLDLDTLEVGQVLDIVGSPETNASIRRSRHLHKTNRFPSRKDRRFKVINGIYHEVTPDSDTELSNPTFNFFAIYGDGHTRLWVRPSRIIKIGEPWFDGVSMGIVHSIEDCR